MTHIQGFEFENQENAMASISVIALLYSVIFCIDKFVNGLNVLLVMYSLNLSLALIPRLTRFVKFTKQEANFGSVGISIYNDLRVTGSCWRMLENISIEYDIVSDLKLSWMLKLSRLWRLENNPFKETLYGCLNMPAMFKVFKFTSDLKVFDWMLDILFQLISNISSLLHP